MERMLDLKKLKLESEKNMIVFVVLLIFSIVILGVVSAVFEIVNCRIMQDDFPDYWRSK